MPFFCNTSRLLSSPHIVVLICVKLSLVSGCIFPFCDKVTHKAYKLAYNARKLYLKKVSSMQRRNFLKPLALTPVMVAGANAKSSDSTKDGKKEKRSLIDSSEFSKTKGKYYKP